MDVAVKNLSMKYHDVDRDVEVFHDLNFEVPSGSSLAIVGKSGTGKTTLLNIMGTLEVPSDGQVLLGGKDVRAELGRNELAAFRGKHIGYVFQFHHLFPEFDALENVAMPLRIQGVSKKAAAESAKSLLERVGLGDRLDHRPGALSGGEQQRVAIARALSARPGLILADEPTGNLDVETGAEINRLLVGIAQETNSTLIVVTHSLELARMMNRILEITPKGIIEREKNGGTLVR